MVLNYNFSVVHGQERTVTYLMISKESLLQLVYAIRSMADRTREWRPNLGPVRGSV